MSYCNERILRALGGVARWFWNLSRGTTATCCDERILQYEGLVSWPHDFGGRLKMSVGHKATWLLPGRCWPLRKPLECLTSHCLALQAIRLGV